jgi:RNA polymerase sigma factor (sigma-70 family)
MDTEELIKEARSGSAAAQKCLFDLLADGMMIVCRRYVKTREDAEEVMLDGFYKFFRGLAEFRYQGEKALRAWIKKIMINESLMFLRKKNAFSLLTEAPPEEMGFDENLLDHLTAAEIFGLVVQLPVGYRTVFNLFVIEGMEHREIAVCLGIAEGTSKSQLSKARGLLQKMLLQKGIDYVKRKTP